MFVKHPMSGKFKKELDLKIFLKEIKYSKDFETQKVLHFCISLCPLW